MSDVKKSQDISVAVEYEHRRAGKVVSRGKQRTDRHRRVHYIQEDAEGRRLGEVICDRDGTVLAVIEGDARLATKLKTFVKGFVGKSTPGSKE